MFYGGGDDVGDGADEDGMFAPEFEPPRASSSVYITQDAFGEIAFAQTRIGVPAPRSMNGCGSKG